MFSSALKTFSSNITANYTLSTSPTSTSGAWRIHDGKNKKTGKQVSVFVFERKSLEPTSGGLGGRSAGSSLKKLHDEVIARVKKECNMLARLRHPSILEIAEPVEDTRNGGLMFATEPVTASLASLLQEKDDQERGGGNKGRPGRYVVEDDDGRKRRREWEIDELEIQKGLLQVAQGLEFLHESAHLVHGNLTTDAIFVNIKSDWKIAGFGFAGPPDNSNNTSSAPPLSLSEALYHDPRLPPSVQLDLDFTSPDFAIDSNVSTSADMFSLGLVILALYNSPHTSPIKSNSNLSTYKKLLSSSSTVPSTSNNFLISKRPPNRQLETSVLPRLITRRPAQRMNAREFQQSEFFNSILVSSIRFLDTLPAKTPNEKSQFMKGLPKILAQFPKSVLDKKVLPALLEETKDRDLLYLILQNVFGIVQILPSAQRAMTDKILPHIKEIFSAGQKTTTDRDAAKEAGLVVVLENIGLVAENCNGKEFKDYMLPILHVGLDSPTHAIVDKTLGCLPTVLSVLDFSTIKHELFPNVATVFSKTSSLGIKIRGLEAFVVLCGGSNDARPEESDDFTGLANGQQTTKPQSASVLDKYTVQEKVVPLLKAMKTKEPAVMMAALAVFEQVGKIADAEFLALETLPILWNFSLGPLLNLDQFQRYMDTIKRLSSRIESEQLRKLRDLSSTGGRSADLARPNDPMRPTATARDALNGSGGVGEDDFEKLVLGSQASHSNGDMLGDPWSEKKASAPASPWPSSLTTNANSFQQPRTITPDQSMNAFTSLSPTTATGAQSQMQRTMASGLSSFAPMQPTQPSYPAANAWPPMASQQQQQQYQPNTTQRPFPLTNTSSSSIPSGTFSSFSLAPPPSASPQPSMSSTGRTGFAPLGSTNGSAAGYQPPPSKANANSAPQPKTGLDAYQSLL